MTDKSPHLDSLFLAALDIESGEQRAAFLESACGGDSELREQVERLLQSHQQAGSFLEQLPPEYEATILNEASNHDRAGALEAGLAATFPEDQAVVIGHAGHSVLKNLRQTMDLPRVVLRDSVEHGHDPIVRPKSAEIPDRDSDSRYQLQGEIARGGMGAILKGRDTDLGRDLAIKVLLDAHKDKPEVVQRFVEEAQIGGQLQHPGIAPVYELGQFTDRRPFFSMKLVKGETLSKLLAEREDAADERGKFLGIFQQICQTMAYAHNRGVIHRDLKPANIMVGAFGEVQVMDWGLAKVLSAGGVADEKLSHSQQKGQSIIQTLRSGVGSDLPGTFGTVGSHTQMGSVMGTPAYMPPEQALGEIDHLDERADVFGLGAILCEILTGKPPYVADDGTQVFRLASRGKLDDCFQRLDNCGADADLIAVAKQCLELEPQERPRNAGVLAERVADYLESVETKLRESELAKVDAQVRSDELRRRQKLALAAGAAIAASLVIGIAASTWQAVRANSEAKRAELAAKQATVQEQRARAALDELRATAPAFVGQARALAAKEQFAEAIEKLDYAAKLRPDVAEFLVAKGDLLQCQLKLAEAAAVYREALRVQPRLARAEASAKLCDELLAAKPNDDGTLSRESLAKLHLALQRQQRPAAELMPVARLLGEEKELLVAYWLERLKVLPVSAEKPLKDRLTVREDGRLALDLSDTEVIDLSPLSGAPLAALDLSKCSDLSDLAPLRGLNLVELNISATSVKDLAPLRDMHTLEELEMTDSKVTGLSELSDLRLKKLSFASCPIRDLTPIQRMPLVEISLRGTRVSDLSPLVGMPIKKIDLTRTPVLDFSPLAELPLEICCLQQNRIGDLSVLRGLPLKELAIWNCPDARNYEVLAEIKTLELLVLPSTYRNLPARDYDAIGALRKHPKLRQLGAEIMAGMDYRMTGAKDVFWRNWDREQTFIPALRKTGFRFACFKLDDGTYRVDIREQAFSDLSCLKGAPISVLYLCGCKVTDLSPLHDLPLQFLDLSTNPVIDLSPLRGTSIKKLWLPATRVTDLSPLREMKNLSELALNETQVSDLSPLAGMTLRRLDLAKCVNVTDVAPVLKIPTLEELTVPWGVRNIGLLRTMPNLKRLSHELNGNYAADSTAADFWKDYDANPWIARLNDAGFKPQTLQRLPDGTWDVDLTGSGITDLMLLNGAQISRLQLAGTAVADLSPLRGMPLKDLRLWNTQVADLNPLKGMSLQFLHVGDTKVTDLSALRGMPLTSLYLSSCPVISDLTPLKGLPLRELYLDGCPNVTDIVVLTEIPTLEKLTVPMQAGNIDALRKLTKLKMLAFKGQGNPESTAQQFWKDYDANRWIARLKDAGFKPQTLKQLPDGTWEVNLDRTRISDLTLLKGAQISSLSLTGTDVSDLRPIADLPLTTLSICDTQVTDLSFLRETKIGANLRYLDISMLKVTDFTPLAACTNLVTLRVYRTAFSDLGVLKSKHLQDLWMAHTRVADLSPLAGMPLKYVYLDGCTEITDVSPLSQCPALEMLILPPNATKLETLRALPNLKKISYAWNAGQAQAAADFWKEYDANPWISRLHEAGCKPKALQQLPDGTWDVDLYGATITDLTILKGAPISILRLGNTAIADLEPLRGMTLTKLHLYRSKVTDLRPLNGMPLRELNMSLTNVTDLSPLRGMPLSRLQLYGCTGLTDLSPLADCKELETLSLPPNAKDIEFLRDLPNLELLSYTEDANNGYRPDKTAAEFWKDYDAKKN